MVKFFSEQHNETYIKCDVKSFTVCFPYACAKNFDRFFRHTFAREKSRGTGIRAAYGYLISFAMA